jgi:hypothetical protein
MFHIRHINPLLPVLVACGALLALPQPLFAQNPALESWLAGGDPLPAR